MQSDYKLIRQVIEGLSMMNNKFMNLMLDDNVSAAQIMLRVILKDDKIKVKNVRIQRFIQNIYGHSAQLDILAEDGFGRYFNVEVQRSDEGASVRRARFYSSVLDTQFLQLIGITMSCLTAISFLLLKMMYLRKDFRFTA